jgi:hypothetical protein
MDMKNSAPENVWRQAPVSRWEGFYCACIGRAMQANEGAERLGPVPARAKLCCRGCRWEPPSTLAVRIRICVYSTVEERNVRCTVLADTVGACTFVSPEIPK